MLGYIESPDEGGGSTQGSPTLRTDVAHQDAPVPSSSDRSDVSASDGGRASDHEVVRAAFEDLGLSGSEARVLVALVRSGAATVTQIARLAGMNRTNVYPALKELGSRGLAAPLPHASAMWTSPGHHEVLERLYDDHEAQLQALTTRRQGIEQLLEAMSSGDVLATMPFVHFLRGAARVRSTYEALLEEADTEVLVCNRPPYSWSEDVVNDRVVRAVSRRLKTRALYQAAQLRAPGADGFRRAHSAYLQAGVEGGVVEELPVKMAIFDKRKVLVAMTEGDDDGQAGYPTVLLIEHSGYAEMHALAFAALWETAQPFSDFTADLRPEDA